LDGDHALGERFGPGLLFDLDVGFGFLGFLGGWFVVFVFDLEFGLLVRRGAGLWVLEFRTQPADQASAFFIGALVVQVDESLPDLFVV
jgi:hypothetical protein